MRTSDVQYRVLWRRKGSATRSRVFATYRGANRLMARLGSPKDDLHWRCDEAHADCLQPIEALWSEKRSVSQWARYSR